MMRKLVGSALLIAAMTLAMTGTGTAATDYVVSGCSGGGGGGGRTSFSPGGAGGGAGGNASAGETTGGGEGGRGGAGHNGLSPPLYGGAGGAAVAGGTVNGTFGFASTDTSPGTGGAANTGATPGLSDPEAKGGAGADGTAAGGGSGGLGGIAKFTINTASPGTFDNPNHALMIYGGHGGTAGPDGSSGTAGSGGLGGLATVTLDTGSAAAYTFNNKVTIVGGDGGGSNSAQKSGGNGGDATLRQLSSNVTLTFTNGIAVTGGSSASRTTIGPGSSGAGANGTLDNSGDIILAGASSITGGNAASGSASGGSASIRTRNAVINAALTVTGGAGNEDDSSSMGGAGTFWATGDVVLNNTAGAAGGTLNANLSGSTRGMVTIKLGSVEAVAGDLTLDFTNRLSYYTTIGGDITVGANRTLTMVAASSNGNNNNFTWNGRLIAEYTSTIDGLGLNGKTVIVDLGDGYSAGDTILSGSARVTNTTEITINASAAARTEMETLAVGDPALGLAVGSLTQNLGIKVLSTGYEATLTVNQIDGSYVSLVPFTVNGDFSHNALLGAGAARAQLLLGGGDIAADMAGKLTPMNLRGGMRSPPPSSACTPTWAATTSRRRPVPT